MENISESELAERVALLKKFRSLLQEQRDKFREYLNVLEKQENSIETENTEGLLSHTELEKQVVSNIASLQKVIVPMSELYRTRVGDKGAAVSETDASTIENLQAELDNLQNRVLEQNRRNRNLLKSHIVSIRTQIASLKNPYRNRRSVYAEKNDVGYMVALEA